MLKLFTRKSAKTGLLLLLLCIPFIISGQTAQTTVYSTWENMEIDKCASAWLIKRFADKNAVFKLFPKGALITEGIPFDTPEAEMRRYHNISTFEYIVKKYKINDIAVAKLAAIIHDIEINYWGAKKRKESDAINEVVKKIIKSSLTAQETLKRTLTYFDELYLRLKTES
jgi:hypothetical protein